MEHRVVLGKVLVRVLGFLARVAGFAKIMPPLEALLALPRGKAVFPKDIARLLAAQSARAAFSAQVFQLAPDWAWPYWVQRQLDPRDVAFTPRGMNPLWFNQTHRTWSAIGAPDREHEAIVDPRGLLTPSIDGFSLDVAVRVGGVLVAPALLKDGYAQEASTEMPLVVGRFRVGPVEVTTQAWADDEGMHIARLLVDARPAADAPDETIDVDVVVGVRPFNPEGPSRVAVVQTLKDGTLDVDGARVAFSRPPSSVRLATFRDGDALVHDVPERARVECDVGLATAAAVFHLRASRASPARVGAAAAIEGPDAGLSTTDADPSDAARGKWRRLLAAGAAITFPDAATQRAWELARLTLLVLDDGASIKPGPATYHQHWFRDSAYLVTALGKLGYQQLARQKLADYRARQDRHGCFVSQEGEWDSTGQAIWTLAEHARLFDDRALLEENASAIAAGARFLAWRRKTGPRRPGCEGLLPAGISAEHLGPHDCYYWDDLWALAGLDEAVASMRLLERKDDADELSAERRAFEGDLHAALAKDAARLGSAAVPAAPGRRIDHGMIGGLCAVHPLKLWSPDDPRVVDTVQAIVDRFLVDGGFVHALIHSGTNPYLTLHVAQCLAAQGRSDEAWRALDRVRALASSCGTWPEAVHPITGGGCMGDGCHGWAAADFLLFLRDAVVAEDRDVLHVTRVFRDAWRKGLSAQRLPTWFGPVDLDVSSDADGAVALDFRPSFRRAPAEVRWRLPAAVERATADGAAVEVRGDVVVLPARPCTAKAWLRA